MNDIKASVTLTGPVDVLAKLLASLGGGVSVATSPSLPPHGAAFLPPSTGVIPQPSGDDDESGDQPVAAGTVDKDGLPHDTRIHSEPAKLTTKGVWRKRRGVTDQEVATVEAELRARAGQPGPVSPMGALGPGVVMSPPMTMPPGYPAPQPAPVMTAPPVQFTAPPVMQPAPAPAPVPQPAANVTDFQSFMMAIQPLLNNGKVDAEYFGNLVQRINGAAQTQFGAITDLASRPDLCGWVWNTIVADGKTA